MKMEIWMVWELSRNIKNNGKKWGTSEGPERSTWMILNELKWLGESAKNSEAEKKLKDFRRLKKINDWQKLRIRRTENTRIN